jgi:hypothetical protein
MHASTLVTPTEDSRVLRGTSAKSAPPHAICSVLSPGLSVLGHAARAPHERRTLVAIAWPGSGLEFDEKRSAEIARVRAVARGTATEHFDPPGRDGWTVAAFYSRNELRHDGSEWA